MTTFEAITILWAAFTLLGNVTLTAINLIAIIWVWTVTARHQRELLDRQLEATDRLTKLPLTPARRAEQFSKIAAWAADTEKLLRLARFLQNDLSGKDELTAEYLSWETAYFTENLQTAQFLDQELANAMKKHFYFSDLYILYALNSQLDLISNPSWSTEIAAAKDAFDARLRALDKTIVEQ